LSGRTPSCSSRPNTTGRFGRTRERDRPAHCSRPTQWASKTFAVAAQERKGLGVPGHNLKRAATDGERLRQTMSKPYAQAYAQTPVLFPKHEKPLQIEWAGQGSNLRPWD
jgi:hypothetical protein